MKTLPTRNRLRQFDGLGGCKTYNDEASREDDNIKKQFLSYK